MEVSTLPDTLEATPARAACIVSCDLIGHSSRSQDSQLRHLQTVNGVARRALLHHGPEAVLWASRGDGGHIVLFLDDWRALAFQLITELYTSCDATATPIRIVCHHGRVATFAGADGRPELLGSDINLVGRIALTASDRQIIATQAFRDAFGVDGDLTFHDAFTIALEPFGQITIYFISLKERFESYKTHDDPKDRRLLDEAVERGDSWKVIYHAKRLLELNESDRQAERALAGMAMQNLTFTDRFTERSEMNPIMLALGRERIPDLLRASQLVERETGDIICKYQDPGDTMYIILDGAVGVILADPDDTGDAIPVRPAFLLRNGEIVGELAYRLNHPRTATLRCLSRTSVLSFSPDRLRLLLSGSQQGQSIFDEIKRFLDSRVVKFLCQELPYLIGTDKKPGPLRDVVRAAERMSPHLEIEDIELRKGRMMSTITHPFFQKEGLFILLGGSVCDQYNREKRLSSNFPIVWCNMPGHIVLPEMEFDLESNLRIARIDPDAIFGFEPWETLAVIEKLKEEVTTQYFYDVFVSYTRVDVDEARKWRDRLRAEGLQVYMDEVGVLDSFRGRVEAAIRDALVFMPLISAAVTNEDRERSWVWREIKFRKNTYNLSFANILPVHLSGSGIEDWADGFPPIDARHGFEEACQRVVAAIREVRAGRHGPPISLERRAVRLATDGQGSGLSG